MATLADVCPHHETERGAAAKVLSRTGSEGVHGGFREQSWKGCLRASFCRCKPNFRGSGVYVPRSVDWHPGSHGIISLIERNRDGNQVAPLTREHPRRRYTPVDYPWVVVVVWPYFGRTAGRGHSCPFVSSDGDVARECQSQTVRKANVSQGQPRCDLSLGKLDILYSYLG